MASALVIVPSPPMGTSLLTVACGGADEIGWCNGEARMAVLINDLDMANW